LPRQPRVDSTKQPGNRARSGPQTFQRGVLNRARHRRHHRGPTTPASPACGIRQPGLGPSPADCCIRPLRRHSLEPPGSNHPMAWVAGVVARRATPPEQRAVGSGNLPPTTRFPGSSLPRMRYFNVAATRGPRKRRPVLERFTLGLGTRGAPVNPPVVPEATRRLASPPLAKGGLQREGLPRGSGHKGFDPKDLR
jgi:hypothetical protein